jgi:hypothetical protein
MNYFIFVLTTLVGYNIMFSSIIGQIDSIKNGVVFVVIFFLTSFIQRIIIEGFKL